MSNIVIEPDGTVVAIYSDDLAGLLAEGVAEVTRASHVEPMSGGGWEADMRPVAGEAGPVLRGADGKGFALRADALAAEIEWINKEVLHVN